MAKKPQHAQNNQRSQQGKQGQQQKRGGKAQATVARTKHCLLYTSDAADEL